LVRHYRGVLEDPPVQADVGFAVAVDVETGGAIAARHQVRMRTWKGLAVPADAGKFVMADGPTPDTVMPDDRRVRQSLPVDDDIGLAVMVDLDADRAVLPDHNVGVLENLAVHANVGPAVAVEVDAHDAGLLVLHQICKRCGLAVEADVGKAIMI